MNRSVRTFLIVMVVGLLSLASGCSDEYEYGPVDVSEVSITGQKGLTVTFAVTGFWGDTQGEFARFHVRKSGATYLIDMIGKTPVAGLHHPAMISLSGNLSITVEGSGEYQFEFSKWASMPLIENVIFE